MDSYNFSSDSTSTFFVKETTSDVNTVNMENIADSILQLNKHDDLHQAVAEDNCGSDSANHKIDRTLKQEINEDDVYVITISDANTSNENDGRDLHVDNTSAGQDTELQSDSMSGLTDDCGDDHRTIRFTKASVKQFKGAQLKDQIILNSSDDSSKIIKKFNQPNDNVESNDIEYEDKSDDKFDMEQFLCSKTDKTTAAVGKTNKKSSAIKKYFTECGSNSVKCNLCSDVLLSNLPNLALHLRHVHKNDKTETNFGKVWKYYTKIDSFKARCNICSSSFIHRNRMSVLVKHLRVTHRKNLECELKSGKNSSTTSDIKTSSDDNTSSTWSSDVIVIQNSDGKLLNQIKVNKSWKCFTKLPNSDKMICNLCKKIFIHNRTHDLLQHLHEEHKNLLGIKQEAVEQSLNESDISGCIEEDTGVMFESAQELSKSVLVQKVSTHSNRLGRSVKSSKIWEYFIQCDNDKIKCKLCGKMLANNHSTSNLSRHLNAKHIEAYNIIKELTASDTEAIKIVIQNENGEPEKDVSVADMLADYENMLTAHEIIQFDEIRTMPKTKQAISETWNYYTKLTDISKVKCNICKVMLSYTEGISSNLTRHLKLKHKDLFKNGESYNVEEKQEPNDLDNQQEAVQSDINVSQNSKLGDSNMIIDVGKKSKKPLNSSIKTTPDLTLGELKLTCDDNLSLVPDLRTSLPDCSNVEINSEESSNKATNLENKIDDNKQRSKAWDYFEKILPENKAVCNICSQEIAFVKGSMYKLFRHLAVKHDVTFKRSPKPRKIFAYESDTSDEDSKKPKSENSCKESSNNSISTTAQLSDLLSGNDNGLNETGNDSMKHSEVKVTGRTWKHFTKLDRDKAKCNLCGKIFTYKLGQSSNLIKHIHQQHKDIDSKRNEDCTKQTGDKGQQVKDDEHKVPVLTESLINKSGVVWKYFSKLEDCKAMCNLCEFPNILSYHKNSRSNLVRHLNRKHKYVLTMSGEDDTFIQRPDISSNSKQHDETKNIMPQDSGVVNENDSSLAVENDDEVQDIKSLFEYLITDEKLKSCIKYENDQIKCKICSGSFVCDNPINYEYTIRYHVQIFHAEWTVMCFDETLIKRECITPVSEHDVPVTSNNFENSGSNYNELEAIANEVSSFMHSQNQSPEKPDVEDNNKVVKKLVKSSNNKITTSKTLSDDIWKYFTKLTSQNVRCNFCSILLSFRQHKKWNLIRHLKLKHKSKLNISSYKKSVNLRRIKSCLSSPSSVKSTRSTSSSSSKISLKKLKSNNPIKKVKSNSSPIKKVKSASEATNVQSETDKSVNTGTRKKHNGLPSKSNKKVKPKEDSTEKKQISLTSFNTPINRRIGRTWSHFTKIEMGKAQCNICSQVLIYRGNGIDLLNDHLTGTHSTFFDESSSSEPPKSYPKKVNFDSEESESSSDSETEVKKSESTIVSKQNNVLDKESPDKKQESRVWQYFSKSKSGYAKCDLCLSEISFRDSTSNLMRHLQNIHSVISLLTPVKESVQMETEQSKLLAAVDLTPAKSHNTNHVCFVRLNKNMVKCKFCPRMLYHKCGNMHKLMSHMLYKHRQETKRYKSLKNVKFLDVGSEVIMKANERREKLPVPSNTHNLAQQKVDKRKIFRSNTWLYFKKLNDHYAKCNICFNAFSYKGGSIYNLTRHLLIKHDVKLIKRFEMPHKKINSISLPTPKSASISRKKREMLLFYKRINRCIVRCKLCMKRFTYKDTNINKLMTHLWMSHITKLIEMGGPHHSNVLKNSGDIDRITEKQLSVANGCDESSSVPAHSDNISNKTVVKDPIVTGRKMSNTWNYFTELNDAEKNIRCNICLKVFCFKSGNLSNLSRHLEKNHNIKKTSNSNTVQTIAASNSDGVADTASCSEKKKLHPTSANDTLEMQCQENDQILINESEIYVFFLKINNSDSEVQCKFCNEVLKRDNLTELKSHLSLKHDIHDFLSLKNDSNKDSYDDCLLPSDALDDHKSDIVKAWNNNTTKLKCKLCYKEFIFRKTNVLGNLIEHLKTIHEMDLKYDDKHLLQENPCLKLDKDENNLQSDFDHCSQSNAILSTDNSQFNINDNVKLKKKVLNYFKNLKLFKNKCTICFKFISSKKPCYHRVTNDLSIRYSVRKVKRRNSDSLVRKEFTKNEQMNRVNSNGTHGVKHFMSVNLYDNKCYDCMASRQDGYCVHSLNLWIMNENKKHFDNAKSEYNNQVSLNTEEVQMIANSLNGCNENNIIIITDNEDGSVLNYNDITNRSESGAQDISYHIMNSINDIDDDDIKVIIYNYNSEESTDNAVSSDNNVKIEEVIDNSAVNAQSSSNKELEEHISNVVSTMNDSSQLIYNNETPVEGCENVLKNKDASGGQVIKPDKTIETVTTDITMINSKTQVKEPSDSTVGFRRPYDIEKLTELAEVSCNEQFYKRTSLLNYTEQSEDKALSDSNTMKTQKLKTNQTPGGSDRCIVETIYPEDDTVEGSLAIEKEYVTRNVVYQSDIESSVVDISPPEQTQSGIEFVEIDNSSNKDFQSLQSITESPNNVESSSKNNEVISEDVINAIFNEVIVNLQENPDDKELSLVKLNNDNIEIPPGLYLQNMKSMYKINKVVLYFSDINYKYKTAKCNLCKMYLEFVEPIIYNLLMHLFTRHKERVCTDEPINKTLIDDDMAADNPNKPRRKSPVWKYFINEKNFRATCKICRFSFSYKGGAINNLSRHLRLRHNIIVSSKNSEDPSYDVEYMLSYPKRRSAVKLRSKTWNYFSKEPNDWAKCRICKKYLSYRSSTINNLTRHLRTIHSKIFNSLFTDKDPIFIKNEDGSLSENVNFMNNEENSDIYNSLMLETSNTKSRDEILQQCSYSMENNNRRKSIVWNYFTEITPNCGKCNFCSKVISCKGGGTSNLSRHLRSRHGIWIVLTSNLSQTFNETMNSSELSQTVGDGLNSIGNNDVNDTIITQEQLHILKNRKLIHKKSKTWEYFTKESADRVRCNLCSKPLSYKCKAVHNLRRHLAKKHPSCIVKPDPVRLKLQINAENDLLHSNEMNDPTLNDANKKFIDITDTSVVIVDEETQLPPHRPDRNSRPKKSIVWNYFEELEYGIAKCLICSKILSFRGGGTNNLMRHLRCRHAIIIVSQSNIDLDALEKEPVVVINDCDKDESDSIRDSVIIEESEVSAGIIVNDTNNIEDT